MISLKQCGTLLLLALLSLPSQLRAAQAPYDIDLKELDREKPAPAPKAEKKAPYDIDLKELDREKPAVPHKQAKKKAQKTKKAAPVAAAPKSDRVRKSAGADGDYIRYTVKPGDHIFKILVVRFGMSNEAAERLIPEIIRVNDISNIKKLTVGRTLLIPSSGRRERVARSAEQGESQPKKVDGSEAAAMLDPAARLEAQGAGSSGLKTPAVQAAPQRETGKPPAATVAKAPAASGAPTGPAHTGAAPAGAAPAAAGATAKAAPEFPAAPALVPANTWICSVTERDPARIVDVVLNALSLPWKKNRIIQSQEGAPNTFSIRVDRYFELKGVRYVVSIGESDPYSYTLLRLLESSGYRVLMIGAGDDFKAVGEKLLRFVGQAPNFGKHALQNGRESTGFLVQRDDETGGRGVVITMEAVDPKLKWTMQAGCGAR